MTRIIAEGLRAGDLKNLVLSTISIDEFESKASKDAIVIAFYVQEKMAATDLDRFIQRTPVDILDVDVSPAPDQRGYYMVFVEISPGAKFRDTAIHIIKEISPLVGIAEWRARVGKSTRSEPLTVAMLDAVSKQSVERMRVEEAARLLSESLLPSIEVKENVLFLGNGNHFRVDAVGTYETVFETSGLNGKAQILSFSSSVTASRLERELGPDWRVGAFADGKLVAARLDDGMAVCLKTLN